jgi:hypothetical protein
MVLAGIDNTPAKEQAHRREIGNVQRTDTTAKGRFGNPGVWDNAGMHG